jgi:gamma-glutamyl-gamma-aminobutyrate hydrolase PuuD
MKRPWIGVNTSTGLSKKGQLLYQLDKRYVDAVKKAGGMPVILPLFETRDEAAEFLAELDGVLFTGGDDIDPKRWGAERHPQAKLMNALREASDFAAIEAALAADKPTLGVCLGCQELNVVAGGSLIQHLPDVSKQRHEQGVEHGVVVEEKTRLAAILGKRELKVLSYHHQAIDRPGAGLVVTAKAADGTVEAVEHPGKRFVVGVQWHPERMNGAEQLFEALVKESGL